VFIVCPTAVSRQLELVVHRQSEPQRGADHLSLHVFSPVADCYAKRNISKHDFSGLIPIRSSATNRSVEVELKTIEKRM
jgi:hypothetical protein